MDRIKTPFFTGIITLDNIIATTNYDMALELYYTHNQKKYIDGFLPIFNPLIKKFSSPTLLNPVGIRVKLRLPAG